MCLSGEVYGSSEFAEGTNVTTSELVGRCGELVVTRSGSHYELGKPHPEYEQLFPNARERMLHSLEPV
ncbi:MAG: hypothetical protein CTY12_00925 [Methylotenera sp.]|nr:MAG: hypothetical protein CTY12_00925 [Methylotenera sp.]